MHDTDDIALLRQDAEEQSEAAFETLVKRHVNLVYSAARRSVENGHQAEEITQAVFIILARKARSLREGTILSGWLYQTARLTAANHLRTEIRRARREKEAHMQSLWNETDSDPWPQIAPLLEHAVGGLNEQERNAIVLRFFEKKSLSEVGREFGTSEDAAKMRVNRALEKLRKFFTKRGITLSATVLAGAVSAHSVQAAPLELATTIAAAAVKGSAVAVRTLTLVKGTLKLMAWTKAKVAIAVGAGVLLVGGGTGTLVFKKWEAYQAHRDSWRMAGLDSGAVERAVPQVQIVPTKFDPPTYNLAQTASNDRWGGIRVSVLEIIWAAYDWRPARIVFADGPPAERYDFMANLPQGAMAALQKELKKTLGFVGRREWREVDVLLLKVKTPNAPGLEPPNPGGGDDWSNAERYYCDDRALSYTNPPHLGLTRFLENVFAKPIIDQTGLTQHFRIDLKWPAPDSRKREAIKEAIREAMLEQLGLELVPGREPVEMLVMEKVP
jgi:uncharacterized protein (TIGR03435 family)